MADLSMTDAWRTSPVDAWLRSAETPAADLDEGNTGTPIEELDAGQWPPYSSAEGDDDGDEFGTELDEPWGSGGMTAPTGEIGSERRFDPWAETFGLEDDRRTELRRRIVEVAEGELALWKGSGMTETSAQATPVLQRYYSVGIGRQVSAADLQSAAWQEQHPWSAVFISYVMASAGAGDSFKRAAAHATYVCAARKAREADDPAKFWAFRIDEARPEVGDLICKDRRKPRSGPCYGTTYESVCSGGKSHCDIVVSVDDRANSVQVIGGNVNQRVASKTITLGADGHLPERASDGCRWIALMKPPGSIAASSASVPAKDGATDADSVLGLLPQRIRDVVRQGKITLNVALAIVSGQRDTNALTNLLFYARHPELPNGYKIKPHETQLAREWIQIRDEVIKPLLRALGMEAISSEGRDLGGESAPEAGPEGAESMAEGVVIRIDSEAERLETDVEEGASTAVRARILWPALGFPAVIAPRANASGTALKDGDATRCLTVLLLSDRKHLSKAEAAANLRYVPWSDRGRRHIPSGAAGSFAEVELEVRNDASEPALALPKSKDSFGELVAFGGNAGGDRAITVNLAERVRAFYRSQGLAYLHEIRVSEQASARIGNGIYHLFWNNQRVAENAPSDEMALLLEHFATPRRSQLGDFWRKHRAFLLDEYEYEYRPLHPLAGNKVKGKRAELLHPMVVRPAGRTLRIGHLTDTHISARADLYGHNLRLAGFQAVYNNWNVSFARGYDSAARDSDVVLITGDLIDYGRGHWGANASKRLYDNDLYHVDRNWFLFQDLVASGDAYRVPVYTVLGNHDWRINPYPPFAAVGAPGPRLFIHDHTRYSKVQQRIILENAHGPGHDAKLSYDSKAESGMRDLLRKAGTLLKALGSLLVQTKTMDVPGSPAETTVDSVAWYLLAINPFFDYSFALPSGHRALMLDWAEDEDVLFPIIAKGQEWPYMLWQLDTAADPGPKAKRSLTDLQRRLVTELLDAPGAAKIIGIHAPPIGPYPDWMDHDMIRGRKTYAKPSDARGPANFATRKPDGTIDKWNGHPIFAIRPRSGDRGMESDYGSFVRSREWFIRMVAGPRSGVRAIFSGHIHRNGLYVVHVPPPSAGPLLAGEMLVRQVVEPAVAAARPPAVSKTPEGANGPLYVSTTSGGPRGNDYSREPTEAEKGTGGLSLDPGYARLDLSVDGTIERVEFRSSLATAARKRELAVPGAETETRATVFDQAWYERLFGEDLSVAERQQAADLDAESQLVETPDGDLERRIAAFLDDEADKPSPEEGDLERMIAAVLTEENDDGKVDDITPWSPTDPFG